MHLRSFISTFERKMILHKNPTHHTATANLIVKTHRYQICAKMETSQKVGTSHYMLLFICILFFENLIGQALQTRQ